jgi:hypothetical protein
VCRLSLFPQATSRRQAGVGNWRFANEKGGPEAGSVRWAVLRHAQDV